MAATSELEFEDMLFARVPPDEPRLPAKVVPGPALQLGQPAKRQEHARAGRCQLSALTASVQSMSLVIDDDAAPASGGGELREVVAGGKNHLHKSVSSFAETLPTGAYPGSEWTRMGTSNPLRLGTSAPVTIPHDSHPWTRAHEVLFEVDGEDQDDEPKATTFVPPHLMVDKPAIEFSLNGSMADKKAKLRARNKILRLTGFIEPSGMGYDKTMSQGVGNHCRIPGALAREFGVHALEGLDP